MLQVSEDTNSRRVQNRNPDFQIPEQAAMRKAVSRSRPWANLLLLAPELS